MRCARPRPAATLVTALLVAAPAQIVAADEGIERLESVVDAACECAAGHATGLDAALACTQGPRDFGRVKVAYRDGWSDGQRRRAEDLERVIEQCIANAMSAADARDLLGLPQAGPVPLVRWRRVPPGDLGDHPARLVRIEREGGATLKGLVETFDGATVRLRVSREDGGGMREVSLDAIRGAWVMELAAP